MAAIGESGQWISERASHQAILTFREENPSRHEHANGRCGDVEVVERMASDLQCPPLHADRTVSGSVYDQQPDRSAERQEQS